MKLLVTAINLDFETDNDFYKVKFDEQIEIEQDCLGIWEVDSEDEWLIKYQIKSVGVLIGSIINQMHHIHLHLICKGVD